MSCSQSTWTSSQYKKWKWQSKDFTYNFLLLVSEKSYFLYCPLWSYVTTMSCGGSHLGFLIHTRNTFCKGSSKEHFSHVSCHMVLRFQIIIILKYFPIGSFLKIFLWWWPSLISSRNKTLKYSKGPSNDYSCKV